MKVKICQDKCIGCGSCVSLTDQKIFDFNDEGLAYPVREDILEDEKEEVLNAVEYCPTSAIEIEEKNQ